MQSVTAPLGGGAMLVHALAKNWWLVLLRGIVSVLFGIVAFIWPGLTLFTLVLFYGAFALVDGVIALVSAFGKHEGAPTWWLILVGIAGIGAGALGLIWAIAAYAIIFGILLIGLSLRLRKHQPAA